MRNETPALGEDFDVDSLRRFVCTEAFRIEQPSALRAKAEQFLRDRSALLPAPSTLSRLIGAEREQARKTIFTRMCEDIPPQLRHRLDRMLVLGTEGSSELNRLKEPPRAASPKAMLDLIERLDQVKQSGVLGLDLSWLNNNFQKCMARRIWHSDIHRLKLLEPSHRYTALVCFLSQTYRDTIDASVIMLDQLMTSVRRRAKQDLDEEVKQKRTSIRTLLDSFRHIGSAILDEDLEPGALREAVFEELPPDKLKEQLLEAREWVLGKKSHSFVGVVNRYGYLRQFSPALIEHLSFAAESTGDGSLLAAIDLLREMNAGRKRKLPAEAPLDFVPKSVRRFVQNDDEIDRHGYEAAVLTALRDELKRGNLWVPGSKRFCKLDEFFIPDSQWATMRDGFFRRAQLPSDPTELAPYLTKRLNAAYDRFLATLPANTHVTIEEDGWQLASDPADELGPEQETELERLESWLKDKIRPIRLPDLLIEVDNDLYFTRHFIPSTRRDKRRGLLKGEQVNALARNVFYGKRGRADWRDFHRQMCSANCLPLVLGCIVYWQIREIERVLAENDLEAAGIDDSLLEHISPVAWDNVLLYGQYRLNRGLVRRRTRVQGDIDDHRALSTQA